MSDSAIEFTLPDVDATEALGSALAESFLRAGAREAGAVLHLRGELGAGKTTCVRALLRRLGVQGLVRSPTYTLVETYSVGNLTCAHVDLYRVEGAALAEELGLRELPGPAGLLLIEWPEKGANAVPPADLELWLEHASAGRAARTIARTGFGKTWLDDLRFDTR